VFYCRKQGKAAPLNPAPGKKILDCISFAVNYPVRRGNYDPTRKGAAFEEETRFDGRLEHWRATNEPDELCSVIGGVLRGDL
jgi:hypothetical protein